MPRAQNFTIVLSELPEPAAKCVWKNNLGLVSYDIGDGILNAVSWGGKMNVIGAGGDPEGILNKAIDLAEAGYKGLVVIGNDGALFTAGANVGHDLSCMAVEQEYDDLDMMPSAQFQNAMMRHAAFISIPVVAAPHQPLPSAAAPSSEPALRTRWWPHAETYMGLVEFGVGLIPAGGGTKEMTLRTAAKYEEGEPEYNLLRNTYMTISTAKVSTSAAEAVDLGFLRRNDEIVVNPSRVIAQAKAAALELADAGYTQPVPKSNIKVHGRGALGMFMSGVYAMKAGNYISEYDQKIADKLAWVMCGGDLSAPTEVSEQYLLDLEREAFLSLAGERKTLERIQSILTTGKPLRN